MTILSTKKIGMINILHVDSNPDDIVNAEQGSLAIVTTNNDVYQNVDGGTSWIKIISRSYSLENSQEALSGAQGQIGYQGRRGSIGFEGPIGIQGFIGVDGFQGPAGQRGSSIIGLQGPQSTIIGPHGPAGLNPAGPQGYSGFPGDDGSISPPEIMRGDRGPQGAQGSDGQSKMGYQGSAGPPGHVGNPGADIEGPQGVGGPTGEKGAQGHPGSVGARGPQGAQGAAGASDYSQGYPGPQGYRGFQGADGVQGSQGPQGIAGLVGVQGLQGPQGSPGAGGYQGNMGPQGIQGSQGFPGLQGYMGDPGPQGPQGQQGLQGARGAQGARGPQGAQGSGSANEDFILVETQSVTTTPIQQITFSGLDGNLDKIYLLKCKAKIAGPSSTTSYTAYLKPNDSLTGLSGFHSVAYASTYGNGIYTSSPPFIWGWPGSEVNVAMILYASSGSSLAQRVFTFDVWGYSTSVSGIYLSNGMMFWDNTSTNITSIVIDGNVTGMFDVGSEFSLYKHVNT